MLVCFVIWTIISARYAIHADNSLGKAVVAMIFLYYLAYNLKYVPLLFCLSTTLT